MKIIALVLAGICVLLALTVIRLENRHYATLIGSCDTFDAVVTPMYLMDREKCLEGMETRTSPLWHLYYAIGDTFTGRS